MENSSFHYLQITPGTIYYLLIAFNILYSLFDIYLVKRQLKAIARQHIPKILDKKIPKSKLQEIKSYARDKAYFSISTKYLGLILTLTYMITFFEPKLWDFISKKLNTNNEYVVVISYN